MARQATGEARLPVLDPADPCRGCGVCCLHLCRPPFHRIGDPAWDRLLRERPELVAAIEADRAERPMTAESEEAGGWPCLWYDPAARRCRHYEHRPEACRDFEPGEPDCLGMRREAGIEAP